MIRFLHSFLPPQCGGVCVMRRAVRRALPASGSPPARAAPPRRPPQRRPARVRGARAGQAGLCFIHSRAARARRLFSSLHCAPHCRPRGAARGFRAFSGGGRVRPFVMQLSPSRFKNVLRRAPRGFRSGAAGGACPPAAVPDDRVRRCRRCSTAAAPPGAGPCAPCGGRAQREEGTCAGGPYGPGPLRGTNTFILPLRR